MSRIQSQSQQDGDGDRDRDIEMESSPLMTSSSATPSSSLHSHSSSHPQSSTINVSLSPMSISPSSLTSSSTSPTSSPQSSSTPEGFLRRRVLTPLLSVLSSGITADSLSLAFSLGIVSGLFPIPFITTLPAILFSFTFKVNFPAVQIANLLMTPINILTFVWYLRVGTQMFSPSSTPIDFSSLSTLPPLEMLSTLGMSIVWGVIFWCLLSPFIAGGSYVAMKPAVTWGIRKMKQKRKEEE